MFFVYVLYSESTNKFYIGSTSHIPIRVARHNAGKVPSTKSKIPWKLVYSQEYPTRSEALRREFEIKSWKNPAYMIKTLGLDFTG
jgi:putative endonuclease